MPSQLNPAPTPADNFKRRKDGTRIECHSRENFVENNVKKSIEKNLEKIFLGIFGTPNDHSAA